MFLLFGGTAALANLSAGWAFYGSGLFPTLPYWCATGMAATIGLMVNFFLNALLNFKFHDRSILQQFYTFFVISLFGVLLTSYLSNVFFNLYLSHLGAILYIGDMKVAPKFIADIAAVGLVVLYSFPAHKLVSFNVGISARLLQLAHRVTK